MIPFRFVPSIYRPLRDLKASLAVKGIPPEAQSQILQLHGQNANLAAEVNRLEEQLQLARASSKNSSRFPILVRTS